MEKNPLLVTTVVLCAFLNASAAVDLPASGSYRNGKGGGKEAPAGVTAIEDLMREHGLLSRILLVYEEACSRLETGKELPPLVLPRTSALVRKVVEDYHERLEEQYLFPRFEKAAKKVDLVNVLREQHQAGRRLTDEISRMAGAAAQRGDKGRGELRDAIRLFIRMYRPHKAREDTILFPAVHSIVPPLEYAALGETFEAREDAVLGEEGFERALREVEELEKALGIYDLRHFTPPRSLRDEANPLRRGERSNE